MKTGGGKNTTKKWTNSQSKQASKQASRGDGQVASQKTDRSPVAFCLSVRSRWWWCVEMGFEDDMMRRMKTNENYQPGWNGETCSVHLFCEEYGVEWF